MIAKFNLQAKVGGISYTVLKGETLPPVLAEFYAANGASNVTEKEADKPATNEPTEPNEKGSKK